MKISGIYFLKCKLNNKVYIGSSVNIQGRLRTHMSSLRHDKHYNSYMQNVFNKYGEDSFIHGVIETCDKNVLIEREQFYINNNCNSKLLNIVIKDVLRPSMSEHVREKIKTTINRMYENGDLPRYNGGSIKKGTEPWNKGKKYKNTEHLRVPKKTGCRKVFTENLHKRMPVFNVLNKDGDIIFSDISVNILEESLKDVSILHNHMILRNPNGRSGINKYILQTVNILTSAKTGKHYKGLHFEYLKPMPPR